jgi:ribonuclease R
MGMTVSDNPAPGEFNKSPRRRRTGGSAGASVLLRFHAAGGTTPVNAAGHFGLAYEDLHFTSPIRRYPDLLVHRVIRRS